MTELTPQQKNKLENLNNFLEKSKVNPNLPLVDELIDINQSLKDIVSKEEQKFPESIEIKLPPGMVLKGDKGDKGDPGETITGPKGDKGDSKVGPQGPKGDRGDDGKTIIGPKGENGKDGSPDTGDEIINKINDSKEQIDYERVKGLEERIKKVENKIPKITGGGGRSSHSTHFYDLSSQTNGVLKIFTVPKNISAILIGSDFPTILMEKNGFTINNTRTQITLTTDNPPSAGSQLLFQYSAVFNHK